MEDEHEIVLQSVARISDQLKALKPNQRELKRQMFSDLYPTIKARLDAGVTKKSILDLLAGCGLKMHPANFKKLLEEEAAKADGREGEYNEGAVQ